MKTKSELRYDSKGPSGNIFCILGEVRKILRSQSRIIDYNNLLDRVTNSHSYEDALKIISEEVILIDTERDE